MKISPIKIVNIWEEQETYPNGKSIFSCNKCNSFNIEEDAYIKLKSLISNYDEKYRSYLNYYFASRGAGNPNYNFVFIDFICSKCGVKHKAFFYLKFKENYFPANEREFFLAEIDNPQIEENIDGVYSREVCQIFMRKLFIRWHILKNMTYIVVPFLGNPYQNTKQRIDLLNEFLTYLHPYKTLLVTRTQTLTQIKKDIDDDIGEGSYGILDKNEQIHPIIKHAYTKTDFHAKFYCGINNNSVEVLVGSHNLHGGTYMENLMFKDYELSKFIDRYLFQINVVPVIPKHPKNEVLIFNRDNNLTLDSFTNNASDIVNKYL